MAQKVWFITGASRGLGFHMAVAALSAGDHVVATARNPQGVEESIETAGLTKERGQLLVVPLDVTHGEEIDAAVEDATRALGRIDVLVNNAGFGQMGFFETVSKKAIQHQFDVNLFGLMEVTRRVLPVMREQGAGHIFNVGSIAGAKGYSGWSSYCATKFAVEGFSESLAGEVEAFGIGVTIVEPGFFRTDFLDDSSRVRSDMDHEAYTKASSEQHATFDAISHQQPGDPAKLAEVLVRISNMENPPLRFAAGSDAFDIVGEAFVHRQAELRQWRDLTCSTDFDL